MSLTPSFGGFLFNRQTLPPCALELALQNCNALWIKNSSTVVVLTLKIHYLLQKCTCKHNLSRSFSLNEWKALKSSIFKAYALWIFSTILWCHTVRYSKYFQLKLCKKKCLKYPVSWVHVCVKQNGFTDIKHTRTAYCHNILHLQEHGQFQISWLIPYAIKDSKIVLKRNDSNFYKSFLQSAYHIKSKPVLRDRSAHRGTHTWRKV